MFQVLRNWYNRNFSDPQVVILALVLFIGAVLVLLFGRMLAPVLTALILAYLLEGLIVRLEHWRVPRIAGVVLVFIGFLAGLIVLLFGLVPLLSRQLSQLIQQIPTWISQGQELVLRLPELYPQLVTEAQARQLVDRIGADLAGLGQELLAISLSSALGLVSLVVFLVLVPILVFFFLKDKSQLLHWASSYLPEDRGLVSSVWQEVDRQIGNYVRGKAVEILIVGAVTWFTFSFLGLQYASLLATLTGLSVVIPFIGAAVITLPVALVAFFQFGWGAEFFWVLVAYGGIQALDGNVLVPLLFSEVVDLHPVAIIVAVLFFGGLWGFWGIFFAIPLATLVNAVLRAWPKGAPPQPAAEAGVD